jgi:hypothetical protein
MAFLTKPSEEDLQKLGVLAYVTSEERARILGLPSGQSQRAIASLAKEIDALKRKGKL